jgi:phosphoglycerol geranylgeranyltransferase
MLIDSGRPTSASFMSNTTPIPRDKPDIVLAHALAAEYLGMKTVYLEAGSGAELTVPDEIIGLCRRHLEIPILVGGGIRTPELANQKVKAGGSFIVIGNVLEKPGRETLVNDFASAIHQK